MKSKENPEHYIKTQNEKLSTGPIHEDIKSGLWQLKPVDKTHFTLKKLGTSDKYLHIKNRALEFSTTTATDQSAHWKEVKVPGTIYSRIVNRQNLDLALYATAGNPTAMNTDVADSKAHWEIKNGVTPPPPPVNMLEVDYLGIGYDAVKVDPENLAANSVSNGSLEAPQVFKFIPGNTSFKVMEGLGDGSNGSKTVDRNVPLGVTPKPGERIFSWSNKARWALNASDYQKSFKQTYSGNVGIPDVASIKLSTSFEDVQKTTQSREAAYVYKDASYSGHVLTLDFSSLGPEMLTDKFKSAVNSLGASDLAPYTAFIKNWGTHFSSDNTMGAKCYYRFTLDKSSYLNSNKTERDFSAGVEASIEGISGGLGVGLSDEQAETAKKETKAREATFKSYGGSGDFKNFVEWSKAAQRNMVVIDLRLASFLELFNSKFFPNDNQIKTKYNLLNEALKQYYKANNYTESGDPRGFFKKGPRSFTISVSRLYVKHGYTGKSEEVRWYAGKLNFGVYDKITFKKEMSLLDLDGAAWFDAGITKWKCNCLLLKEGQQMESTKSFNITLKPEELSGKFATITGNMTQTWHAIASGLNSMGDKEAFEPAIGETIPLADLKTGEVKQSKVTYTNVPAEGDIVEIYFNVKRTK